MEFSVTLEGLDDIAKALEESTSSRTVYALNKRIVKAGQEAGRNFVKARFPRSSNLHRSGAQHKGSSRGIPDKHAADNIPLTSIYKDGDVGAHAFIGWRPSDTSKNFYGKFYEEGANGGRIPARHFFRDAKAPADARIREIGLELYQKKLKEVFGQ